MSAARLNARLGNSTCDAPAATAAWVAQRRDYAALRRRKRETFLRNRIDIESKDPRQLWRSVDVLMGRGRFPPCDAINATEFHRFFDAKVDGVRATTANAPSPVAAARVWNSLPDFVTASTSLPMFKRHLKTVLFAKSY